MPDRQTLKSFCRVVSITAWTTSSIDLSQTTSDADLDVECTHVSVEIVSAVPTTDGFFRVSPTNKVGYAVTTTDPSTSWQAAGAQASVGAAGVVGGDNSVVTLTLPPSLKQGTIDIQNSYAAITTFAINYGVVQHANALRDNNLDSGS